MTSNGLKVVYAFAREMHSKKTDLFIQYGTAGFRTKALHLDHVVYRMGLLATLRSRVKDGQTVGVMITASHNLEPDNGVKLIDPDGEMLEQSWEAVATRLANVSDNDLEATTQEIVKEFNVDMSLKASVYIGMDTRYTSPGLTVAAGNGVVALKGTVKQFGIVTTPMLHYFVKCRNYPEYGVATEEGYIDKIVGAFKKLRGDTSSNGDYKPVLFVDGANGVGGKKLNIIKRRLDGLIDLTMFNTGGNGGKLNLNCGADHVKVTQTAPVGVEHIPYQRVASLDGDSDRIVYYYLDDENKMHLLDGDRIATLLAGYIMQLVKKANIEGLRIGLVQTAYANGGSTDYITKELCVPVTCVKTGVKHLHHAAQQYDIGVYFEANGHGTVLYSRRAKDAARLVKLDGSPAQKESATQLLCLIDMTNETVGDAISDMFLVESALCAYGWDVTNWLKTYQDLPCRQLKVTVEDRNLISTRDAERLCTSPPGLQERINTLTSRYARARAFVRPSGTEDIVRVYAEAATQQETEKLAAEVAVAVFELAGGVGERLNLPE